eukprot:1697339-Pyramimonas_sp.AAC.1
MSASRPAVSLYRVVNPSWLLLKIELEGRSRRKKPLIAAVAMPGLPHCYPWPWTLPGSRGSAKTGSTRAARGGLECIADALEGRHHTADSGGAHAHGPPHP